ncbi:sigma-54-dependent Fis family transcriptional regulator [bacterium]|nr:sigma-54-dependent Fis family transcriptional regulator [candidate division CSSED10-310 bacterium]
MSKSKVSVLLVEDETPQRIIMARILEQAGYDLREAGSTETALESIGQDLPDIILCDFRLPGRSGGELLADVRRRRLNCGFIIMTAYGSIARAVEAIRQGADDYLTKPFERDALLLSIDRVVKTRALQQENVRLRREIAERSGFASLVGASPVMQQLYRTIAKVARTDVTVLLVGESGTGKEVVARTLHKESDRGTAPFVAINCAAIPETLIESELFGHERGAFTGAHRLRRGKFEEADGGTVFLDEIASMPPAIQASLLRVLQERRFTRLGGTGELTCEVRVIAATNRDLQAMTEEGAFREDLFYRLNVVPITVPPLRDRNGDIALLATHFLRQTAKRHNLEVESVPPAVLRRFMEYPWPGNVRQLANVIERLVLLSDDGIIRIDDLPPEFHEAQRNKPSALLLPAEGLLWDRMEESFLRQAMERSKGNRAIAARLLGMSYKTFMYRLEKYHLNVT